MAVRRVPREAPGGVRERPPVLATAASGQARGGPALGGRGYVDFAVSRSEDVTDGRTHGQLLTYDLYDVYIARMHRDTASVHVPTALAALPSLSHAQDDTDTACGLALQSCCVRPTIHQTCTGSIAGGPNASITSVQAYAATCARRHESLQVFC